MLYINTRSVPYPLPNLDLGNSECATSYTNAMSDSRCEFKIMPNKVKAWYSSDVGDFTS